MAITTLVSRELSIISFPNLESISNTCRLEPATSEFKVTLSKGRVSFEHLLHELDACNGYRSTDLYQFLCEEFGLSIRYMHPLQAVIIAGLL